MTVSNQNQKLKITLTNTEVLTIFGGYEELLSLNKNTKYAVYALVREILDEEQYSTNKTTIKIKSKKPLGCEITLNSEEDEYLLFFKNCQELENAIKTLNPNLKSSLYKTENSYCLLIKSLSEKPLLKAMSYCSNTLSSKLLAAHIKEYAKPLIKYNAINIWQTSFIGFSKP